MRRTLTLLVTMLPPTLLPAQDPPEPAPHAVLTRCVGTWHCTMSMRLPGAERPTRIEFDERAELVCDGLWLKSFAQGTVAGRTFQGLALTGYDPKRGRYVNLVVDEGTSGALSEGTFDAAKGAFEFKTVDGPGPSRTTLVFHDADHATQVGYQRGADGKETIAFELERRRADPKAPPAPPTAIAVRTDAAHPLQVLLRRLAGDWTCEMQMPDGSKVAATEKVHAICDGNWYWTDFRADIGGQPFSGHGLWGFEVATSQFVCYWIDSQGPRLTSVRGNYDEKTEELTLEGNGPGPDGADRRLFEVATWQGDDRRRLVLEFGTGATATRMTLDYERQRSTGGYHIKKTP